jgi:dTDP-4-dehydrorhamnose reductase
LKAILIGANGQLGVDLLASFHEQRWDVIPVTHADVDICDRKRLSEFISANRPDLVINTAAFHKVEDCERRPQLAFEVNATGAMNLATVCAQEKTTLVHFSTDYVFDGLKGGPYLESDPPRPLNVYGASKMAGEHLLMCNTERFFVIRTCGLYGLAGSSGKGGNFVELMLRKRASGESLRVVSDQVLTPTYTVDLAAATTKLVQTKDYGIYHISGDGQCSWYEFARAIFELEGLSVDLTPVETDRIASPVKRPSYSVLSKEKFHKMNLGQIPLWRSGLERYLGSRNAGAVGSAR